MPFEYQKAKDIADALHLLQQADGTGRVIAGGTNIIPDIGIGKQKPGLLIDINHLKELHRIEDLGDRVHIGALVTLNGISKCPILRDHGQLLFDAAHEFADPTIRNRATIGGNIANASPAADSAPPLLALDAEVLIVGPSGERRLPIAQFFTWVNRTALAPDEIITAVEFPYCPAKYAFCKVGMRNAMAISVTSVAVALEVDSGGFITKCRIALGSVAPTPVRATETEALLTGHKPDKELLARIAETLAKDISPIEDVRATKEYRESVSVTIVQRAVLEAYEK